MVKVERNSVLTVMTLNVWGANEWRRRRSAIVDWIDEVRPDLLALQEVIRSRRRCQASWIAERTDMTATFGAASPRRCGAFGNAVLSRFPVRLSAVHRLTDASAGNEPRAVTAVEVDVFGRRVWFASTHLSHRFDEGWVRERQVRDIADVVRDDHADFPPIVAGDFNAAPETTEVRLMNGAAAVNGLGFPLIDAFEVAKPGQPGYTWSNANPYAANEHEPDRRIDYIFVGGRTERMAGKVLSARVVCDEPRRGAWPSDHFGVAAELLLPTD